MCEQPLFAVNASAITTQMPCAPDDAMTGNNQGERVGTVGIGNGTEGRRLAQGNGLFPIAFCLAIGNLAKSTPDLLLKGCADKMEGCFKNLQISPEIGL